MVACRPVGGRYAGCQAVPGRLPIFKAFWPIRQVSWRETINYKSCQKVDNYALMWSVHLWPVDPFVGPNAGYQAVPDRLLLLLLLCCILFYIEKCILQSLWPVGQVSLLEIMKL